MICHPWRDPGKFGQYCSILYESGLMECFVYSNFIFSFHFTSKTIKQHVNFTDMHTYTLHV